MAETVGFEPTFHLRRKHLSRVPLSTTQPSLHKLATPEGFEPPTLWVETTRSDPLSYGANKLAEGVRFELTDLLRSEVFKTSGLNHSPTLPKMAEGLGFEPR